MSEPNDTHPPRYSAAIHRHIVGLIADFARFSDGRQWLALTGLLAPSLQLGDLTQLPGVVGRTAPSPSLRLSAEEFVNRWRTMLESLGTTQHSLVAKHIAVYEGEATCFVDALITTCHDPENVLQWGGQFWFVFVPPTNEPTDTHANGWRISNLSIVPLWITNSPDASSVLAHVRELLSPVPGSAARNGNESSTPFNNDQYP